MRIFVIGGTGFIGKYVVASLARAGHELLILHRGNTTAKLPGSVNRILGDRRQLPEFAVPLRTFSPDAILDTCAYQHADAVAVADAAHYLKSRVVLLSSMDVYRAYGIFIRLEQDAPLLEPFDETAPLRSRWYPYRDRASASDDLRYYYDKIPVEQYLLRNLNQPLTILRLAKVYGFADPQRHVEQYFELIRGNSVCIPESRARWRWSRLYVENAADAICRVLTDPVRASSIYNVADDAVLSEEEWITKLAAAREQPVAVDYKTEQPEQSYQWEQPLVADGRKFRAEFSWRSPVSLEAAVKRAIGCAK